MEPETSGVFSVDVLSTTDFASLRAEHPEFAGGTPGRVRLSRDTGGAVR